MLCRDKFLVLLIGFFITFNFSFAVRAEKNGDTPHDIENVIEKWQQIKTRINGIKIPKKKTINVTYRNEPFGYVETIEVLNGSGQLPLRGVAFDLENSRVVIIQNLFGTAGARLTPHVEQLFKKMLRNLLPRQSLMKSFELEVVGFTDIQNFGDAFSPKNCDFSEPGNNACLGLARANNTTRPLNDYVQTTLGSQLPIIKKYDPDPLMHNLNIRSNGKIWIATGAGDTAQEISQLLSFPLQTKKAYSKQDIEKIRAEAGKVIKNIGSDFEKLLQPFRCAIVIAWRS